MATLSTEQMGAISFSLQRSANVVAVGNNLPYGGSNDARSHIDCVLLRGTLSLDGQPLEPAA